MKTKLATSAVLAFALVSTSLNGQEGTPAESAQSVGEPPPSSVLVCVACTVVVIGVGGYCLWELKRFCDTYLGPPGTNSPPCTEKTDCSSSMPPLRSAHVSMSSRVQWASSVAGPWQDLCTFTALPSNGLTQTVLCYVGTNCVAYRTSTVDSNGFAFMDFGQLLPEAPSSSVFRLVE